MTNKTGFKKYLSNTSWIMAERIFNMGISFVVTIFVARYLGSEQFGMLAYALSLIGLFVVFGHMGLSGLVVREIVKYPNERAEVLGTTMALKSLGLFFGFVILVAFTFMSEEIGSDTFWILLIVATSILFKPFDVIDFWFASQVQAKYTSIARTVALVASSLFKIGLIFAGASVVVFAFANVLQAVLAAVVMLVFYYRLKNIPFSSWKASFVRAKELLSQGWMIFLGSIFAVIYLKVDQVMIKWLVGAQEVGIYAVAATLSEAWYFIPTAIVASLFPKLIKLRESNESQFYKRLQQLFDILFSLAFVVAITVSLLATPVILFFFGADYVDSSTILIIHIWAALFIFMRAAFSKWILIENVLMFSLITQGFGALANVILNLLLIPHFGGEGAAYATLLSYAMASYISLFFYAKSRKVFWMMSQAMLSPVRYPFNYFKGKLL